MVEAIVESILQALASGASPVAPEALIDDDETPDDALDAASAEEQRPANHPDS